MPTPEVDALIVRLFALLGVPPPTQGSVVFDFDKGKVSMVRPTSVIRIPREKDVETRSGSAHTQQRIR